VIRELRADAFPHNRAVNVPVLFLPLCPVLDNGVRPARRRCDYRGYTSGLWPDPI
ncbi:hypothetical protein A2U01_0100748, partial [Trifolium medium]|nr:hypothetical protein [Trifolium medium]